MKTIKERKKLLEILQKRLDFLELQDSIKAYNEYLGMSYNEKKKLGETWDKYYKLVRKTKVYKIYKKLRELFKNGQIKSKEFKKLWLENKDIIENQNFEVAKPYLRDPDEFKMGSVYAEYDSLKKRIKYLKDDLGIVDL